MKRSTAAFLVLLRLVVGWHFLFEGLNKLHSTYLGPTTTNRPFSSESFFREAPGPAGQFFRNQIGDPDERTLNYLSMPEPDQASAQDANRMPVVLDQEWNDFLDRFSSHYNLTKEQRRKADEKLKKAKIQWVQWQTTGKKQVKKIFPTGSIEETLTTPARVQEYWAKLKELRETLDKKLPLLGKDVEKQQLSTLRAQVHSLREDLQSDLDQQTRSMQMLLEEVLTEEQRLHGPVPGKEASHFLVHVDWITRWGLTLIGACLLLGVFTRINCLLAAGFLILTYLCYPPFPWLPSPPQNEGNYAFINKNVVEFTALLVLSTLPTGRWLGLDAWFHAVTVVLRRERGSPGRGTSVLKSRGEKSHGN